MFWSYILPGGSVSGSGTVPDRLLALITVSALKVCIPLVSHSFLGDGVWRLFLWCWSYGQAGFAIVVFCGCGTELSAWRKQQLRFLPAKGSSSRSPQWVSGHLARCVAVPAVVLETQSCSPSKHLHGAQVSVSLLLCLQELWPSSPCHLAWALYSVCHQTGPNHQQYLSPSKHASLPHHKSRERWWCRFPSLFDTEGVLSASKLVLSSSLHFIGAFSCHFLFPLLWLHFLQSIKQTKQKATLRLFRGPDETQVSIYKNSFF